MIKTKDVNFATEEQVNLLAEALSQAIRQLSPIQRKELTNDLMQTIPLAERKKMFHQDWHDPVSTWMINSQSRKAQ